MFTNNKEIMKKAENTSAVNMIGADTTINGDIHSKGDIRVDGMLNGSVNTEGKVVLGKKTNSVTKESVINVSKNNS